MLERLMTQYQDRAGDGTQDVHFIILQVLANSSASADIFFFSSRRWHTRSTRDWSSDVCSSDLVVDVDPGSSSYSEVVGRVEMPNAGDELHHFGWNACSSALCPYAPHPHVERRYLLVPGLRSSNIHILDTKPDPLAPKIVKVIEAKEIAERAGY